MLTMLLRTAQRLSTAERDVLASFSSTNVVRCGSLPKDVLLQLYKKEKIYIEIPVEQDDTFEGVIVVNNKV